MLTEREYPFFSEQQLWQTVRAHLRSLEKLQSTSITDVTILDQRRQKYVKDYATTNSRESSVSVDDAERNELIANYKKVQVDLEEEQLEINRALEKLEVLLAVRDDGNFSTVIDPLSSKRKKRRLDAGSISPTLQASSSINAKDRGMSPISIEGDSIPASGQDRKRGHTKVQSGGSGTGSAGTGSMARRLTASSIGKDSALGDGPSTSSGAGKDGYIDPAKARRETLAHQLPLQKGRKVAFRQPSKNKVGPGAANVSARGGPSGDPSSAAGMEDDGETWIMATVIECINNDRNRYVVRDDEDEGMPTYNTTLKAVVPLPENLNTLPLDDYKVGTHVLGLYPDTSCFYRAIVRGGGPGLNGKVTQKMMRKADEILNTPYQLEFEDDDGAIRDVPANLVVERL
jgi:SGF29 tudor-like domain